MRFLVPRVFASSRPAMPKYYAVRIGKFGPSVYDSWDKAEQATKGFKVGRRAKTRMVSNSPIDLMGLSRSSLSRTLSFPGRTTQVVQELRRGATMGLWY